MSLFDVIKYPLSYPPTMEELSALPVPVWDEWTAFVHENNSRHWYTSELSFNILRYMLQDYEEPE